MEGQARAAAWLLPSSHWPGPQLQSVRTRKNSLKKKYGLERRKKKFGLKEINQEMREETAEAFLNRTQTHARLLAGSVLNVHMAPFV